MNLSKNVIFLAMVILIMTSFVWSQLPVTFAQSSIEQQSWIRIGILIDKSASADANGVPKLNLADLKPLFDLLIDKGCELAIGTVQESSERPLLRLFIDTPPQKPIERESNETNVFLIAQEQLAFKQEQNRYLQTLSYHQDSARFEIGDFTRRLDSLLSVPDTFRMSDVNSAVRRIKGFITEPDISQERPSRKFALFCTDGQHNRDNRPVTDFPPNVTLILVPGGLNGVLDALNPIQFENPQAAIRFIIAKCKNSQSIKGGK